PAREVSPSHRERAPPRRTQDPRNVSRVNALDGQPTAVQGTSPVQDREPASNRTEKEQEEGQRGGDRKEEANSGHRGLGGLVPLGEGHWEVFLLRHRATFAGPGPSMWPRRLACCDSTVSSSHSRLWVSFTSRLLSTSAAPFLPTYRGRARSARHRRCWNRARATRRPSYKTARCSSPGGCGAIRISTARRNCTIR